ncbi:uncharacterized protein CTHT_0051830 [Thermochaetoides thermophila DSM 1495]|uniref:HD/PDEase domain-containing protein n=1 Tax=Chaetomium thermophilum (strain DSM 1495 / CBS 144.50 / IMI 039719) TaxID=759272 RepID=G0SDH8_CHATD|nr:hypothetical protein CTHT_0051830 [Thermochaetoides thermophila DSM 1495]EGS18579.1 hypothetical protein CTHT_0051830 [Thermochaetoides thermophila DSM 1495]
MSEPSPNPILSLPDVHTAFAAFQDDPLVQAVTAYVKEYMKRYDASHSWDHVERVVAMAHHIYEHSPHELKNKADLRTVHLAALVHDVGDHKYRKPEEPLLPLSELLPQITSPIPFPADLAQKLQTIIPAISYTHETRHPSQTLSLIIQHPELAIVQDADRLDAMGAVGIGRMFTYGDARGNSDGKGRSLAETMKHLDEKLLKLEGMMKTDVGKEVARVRGRG